LTNEKKLCILPAKMHHGPLLVSPDIIDETSLFVLHVISEGGCFEFFSIIKAWR
jgi:hypothetical protein